MPRISVVVPIYNVEEYLGACLESLAQQTVTDLEVIMVDDGSPDGSAAVAADYAERDSRFRLVQQPNGGLGNARNTGVAHAGGDYLAFVDSDDVVLRHAYELLLGSLEQTGSDFASGNVRRLSSAGTRQSPMFAEAFRTTRRRTHVRVFPPLLKNRTAWNKLWRRDFWDEHALAWPEGVLYEDTALTVPAHVLARSVDVLSEPVYLWRIRDGEDQSITQRRVEPQAIRDRFLAVDEASRFLAEHGEHELKRVYDETCAAQDFRYTLEQLDEADEEFRALFTDLVNDFFDRAHPEVFESLRAIDRLKYHLLRRRLVPEVLEVLRFERSGGPSRTLLVRDEQGHLGDYPFRTDAGLDVPRHVYALRQELRLRSRVDDVWWEGDTLRVTGFAYIRSLDLPTPDTGTLTLSLEQVAGRGKDRTLPVTVTRERHPSVTADAPDALYCYDGSGFTASIPAGEVVPAGGRAATWRLVAEVTCQDVSRRGVVSATAPGRAQRPEALTLDRVRVVPTRANGSFAVVVDPDPARVEDVRADGDVVELEGTLSGRRADPAGARLQVTRREGATTLTYPLACRRTDGDPTPFLGRIPLPDLVRELEVGDVAAHSEDRQEGVSWDVRLVPRDGAPPVSLTAPAGFGSHHRLVMGREVVLGRTRQGKLELVERHVRPELTRARWSETGRLELAGRFPEPSQASHVLVLAAQGRSERYSFPMERAGDTFAATLTPLAVETLAGRLPLTEGVWDLCVERADGTGPLAPVTVDHDLFPALPTAHREGAKDLVLVDVEHDSVHLDVSADLLPEERGGYRQRRLQTDDFPALLRRELRDAVLFEGYGGRQFADSPRAVYEELARRGHDLDLLWTVDDGQTQLPEGLTAVRKYSRAWYEALARSRYQVSCTYRPLSAWMDTHPDQVVLQTWHGAPFKKIGFDSERTASLASADYSDRLARETSRWDYLVSPNPVATPILRSAFRFEGTLLESGYPRTDVFFREDREAVAARVRRTLGIPDGRTVVLYAPTFRDDQAYGHHRFRLDMHLDLDDARRTLGDDHVLLVRRHQKIVDTVGQAGQVFVRDVSLYPDVNELLLATDVLVTDYSSLMFDFANTGRPMLFFTYDLEDYRDRLRGFYFDVDRLPGPRLTTSGEVVQAVRDAARHRREHAAAYDAFTRDFCAFDDGKASARVVDHVFGV